MRPCECACMFFGCSQYLLFGFSVCAVRFLSDEIKTHVTVKLAVQNVFDEGHKVLGMVTSQTIVDLDDLKIALKK